MERALPPARSESAPMGISLADLVREIPGAHLAGEGASVRVTGVHHDSRAVEPGDLFVARPGQRFDGSTFIEDAVRRGAAAILRSSADPASGVFPVPVIHADDVPRALAYAAAAVYGHPTFGLDVVGITGTNGKTTTSRLVAKCIQAGAGRCGIVGTLGHEFEGWFAEAKHTSPEADELARIAATMKARGATHLVMEVSSIALAAARADAVRFRVAALTNLTQDHLDYHGDMASYADAKARLFIDLGPSSAAINEDDAFGVELGKRLAYGLRKARYSAKPRVSPSVVEVAAERVDLSSAGIRLTARTPSGLVEVASSLVGEHNVENLLCAISIAWLLEIDRDAIGAALSTSFQVPGRLERCDEPGVDDVIVVVDYAHTPDALERALKSVRAMTRGRVLCVFGCGGDRDPGKRPLMGAAVGRGADLGIVTNDNPRSEDPRAIAAQIVPGLEREGARFTVELDRERAIQTAVLDASPGDVVLIAGKGHEPYQIIGAVTSAFDDRVVGRAALAMRRGRGGAA
ncbi:MAG: UDP-N-acetylmuramoyl-L-alanyl-D-glutamate--2,6-diaminopimelate ligase [Polyangiaceae bacterium]